MLFGIWDYKAEQFIDNEFIVEDFSHYSNGDGVFSIEGEAVKSLLRVITKATGTLEPGQTVSAGIWNSQQEGVEYWTDFDVTGFAKASQYLHCF